MTNLEVFSKDNARAILTREDTQFPVDFDKAWQWLEYTQKVHAKTALLKCGFKEGVDFNLSKEREVRLEGTRKVQRQVETIHLTIDCFKQWAMMSGTEVGTQVRLYFLECEKELKAARVINGQHALIESYRKQAEHILYLYKLSIFSRLASGVHQVHQHATIISKQSLYSYHYKENLWSYQHQLACHLTATITLCFLWKVR